MDDVAITKYIIDPNGDVVIRLCNFDAPFAVLHENDELHVVPPKTTGLFGAMSLGDIPRQPTKQSQSPSNGVGHEPVRVAPPGPGENTATSGAQKEPSTAPPEIHLQVSSAHLTLASRYFKKAFGGPFKESQPGIDGLRHVDASDWDREALLIVLRIIHGRNRQVPKSLDLEMLAKVAVIVDYYECHEVVDAFVEIWHQRIKGSLCLGSLDRNLILLLHVSWVFRWTDEFKATTKLVLHHSKGLLPAIDERRKEVLRKISYALGCLTARFRMEPPDCSFECASMNLGALSRQIYNSKELNTTGTSGSLEGQSFGLMMEATRKIRSPNWSGHIPGRPLGPFCHLSQLVKSEMDKLENLDGLSLEDFVHPV
ncbi:hypothetical protein F5B21DRAFT_527310 [Xylaria acuta]|nr:hypothetical protein F5B21DRAFT_527310 [Xylaria acuta]